MILISPIWFGPVDKPTGYEKVVIHGGSLTYLK